jgi:hypothetical protein
MPVTERPMGTTSRDQHGMEIASRLVDTDERAAMRWLHEHEALPWHKSSQCPMSQA